MNDTWIWGVVLFEKILNLFAFAYSFNFIDRSKILQIALHKHYSTILYVLSCTGCFTTKIAK